MLKINSNEYGIENGRKYYVQYEPYIVFMAGDNAYTRRLYQDNIGTYFNYKNNRLYIA